MINIKHKKVGNWVRACESGYRHHVSVPWEGQDNYWWNEVCADVVEVFGLPGNRFMSRPNLATMDFYFKSEKDAVLCKILLSDKISQSVDNDLNNHVQ